MQGAHPIRILIQGLQSSCLYPGFTEFPFLSKVSKFPSLSRVYRVLVSIQGLQSSRLYPGITKFPSLSRVYRVPVSIQDLQSSSLYPGYTEFPSLYFLCFWQEGGGRKRERNPSFSALLFSFFSK